MISKLLRHIRAGTLTDVSFRWIHSRFNSARWMCAGYTVYSVIPNGSLKLYRDSKLSHLIRYGDFEPAERAFVQRFLKPNDVFVDIGANIGLYSVLAAGLVGTAGGVISFEPSRRTFRRLVENVQRNGLKNVSCVHAALSDVAGTSRLYATGQDMDAWNSLSTPTNADDSKIEEVSTLRWDDYRHALKDRVAMMKIDVEGWEAAVLQGARRGLSGPNAPVLQVEFCDENARSAGSSCAAIYNALADFGYELYQYESEDNRLYAVRREASNDNCNLYAIKDLDRVMTRLRKPIEAAISPAPLSQSLKPLPQTVAKA